MASFRCRSCRHFNTEMCTRCFDDDKFQPKAQGFVPTFRPVDPKDNAGEATQEKLDDLRESVESENK